MSESDFQKSEMSLTDPNIFDKAKARVLSFPVSVRLIGSFIFGLVVIGGVLFGIDKRSNWRTTRETNKIKANIANGITKIANIQTQISNLEVQKAETQGELKRDVETYANQTYGREDDKIRTNQALANYNQALKTNTNIDATRQQIEDALKKLDDQQ